MVGRCSALVPDHGDAPNGPAASLQCLQGVAHSSDLPLNFCTEQRWGLFEHRGLGGLQRVGRRGRKCLEPGWGGSERRVGLEQ